MSGQIDFSQLLDGALREEREDDDHEPRKIGVYYASDLGAECMRQLYLRYIFPEKQFDSRSLRVFKLGAIIHSWIAPALKQQLKKQGYKVKVEANVPPYVAENFEIRGRADLVIGNKFVIDFKSVAPKTFDYNLPKNPHYEQLNFYMNQLGIEIGCIVYVEKYGLRLLTCPVAYNLVRFDGTVESIAFLHRHLVDKTIPAKVVAYPNDYPCTYCDLIQECGAEK